MGTSLHQTSPGAPYKKDLRKLIYVDQERVRKTTSAEVLGELQTEILNVVLGRGLRRFMLGEIHTYLRTDRGVEAPKSKICEALKRLVMRGILSKIRRGLYGVTDKTHTILNKARIFSRDSYKRIKGSGKTHGTREPRDPVIWGRSAGFLGLCPGGVCFDNVRGYSVSGEPVRGDRGSILSGYGLFGFEGVSYAELTVPTFTGYLKDLGQVVVYYGCVEVRGVGVYCGDRVEWRPPGGFVKGFGLVFARREFVEVLLRVLGVLLVAVKRVVGVAGLMRILRKHLRIRSPWAYEILGSLCRSHGLTLSLLDG